MIADFELVGGDWVNGVVCRGAPDEPNPNGFEWVLQVLV